MAKKAAGPKFVAKEWNAGGAFHFYGTRKPRTFIVEVETTEAIKGDLLQQAVDRTLERMPYYKQTFVRKKGLYYYADNDLPLMVAESAEPRTIGDETTNYHMLDVTYSGSTISFSMFHGLTDGLGLNRFIEATLYHYFCLKDGKEYSAEGIVTDAIPFDEAELEDVFERETGVSTKELKKLADAEKRFRLPEFDEVANKGPRMYRLPLRIKTDDLLSWCKACGATPTTAITAVMDKAIMHEHNVSEGVIMGCLPYSLRRALHADKTFKNSSSAVFIPAKVDDVKSLETGALAAKLRGILKQQTSEDMVLLMSASINMIVHLGKKLPTYCLKNKVMAMPENRPQDTFSVDYVGSLTTNDYSDQISAVSYLNADPYKGSLFVVMSETAGYFHLNLTQTFESDRYYRAFCAVLDEEGIPYEKLPRGTYLNPEVELPAEQK